MAVGPGTKRARGLIPRMPRRSDGSLRHLPLRFYCFLHQSTFFRPNAGVQPPHAANRTPSAISQILRCSGLLLSLLKASSSMLTTCLATKADLARLTALPPAAKRSCGVARVASPSRLGLGDSFLRALHHGNDTEPMKGNPTKLARATICLKRNTKQTVR